MRVFVLVSQRAQLSAEQLSLVETTVTLSKPGDALLLSCSVDAVREYVAASGDGLHLQLAQCSADSLAEDLAKFPDAQIAPLTPETARLFATETGLPFPLGRLRLHQHVDDSTPGESNLQRLAPGAPLRLLHGYLCETNEQLLLAYRMLVGAEPAAVPEAEPDVARCMLRPLAFPLQSLPIMRTGALEVYPFDRGPVLLELMEPMQVRDDGTHNVFQVVVVPGGAQPFSIQLNGMSLIHQRNTSSLTPVDASRRPDVAQAVQQAGQARAAAGDALQKQPWTLTFATMETGVPTLLDAQLGVWSKAVLLAAQAPAGTAVYWKAFHFATQATMRLVDWQSYVADYDKSSMLTTLSFQPGEQSFFLVRGRDCASVDAAVVDVMTQLRSPGKAMTLRPTFDMTPTASATADASPAPLVRVWHLPSSMLLTLLAGVCGDTVLLASSAVVRDSLDMLRIKRERVLFVADPRAAYADDTARLVAQRVSTPNKLLLTDQRTQMFDAWAKAVAKHAGTQSVRVFGHSSGYNATNNSLSILYRETGSAAECSAEAAVLAAGGQVHSGLVVKSRESMYSAWDALAASSAVLLPLSGLAFMPDDAEPVTLMDRQQLDLAPVALQGAVMIPAPPISARIVVLPYVSGVFSGFAFARTARLSLPHVAWESFTSEPAASVALQEMVRLSNAVSEALKGRGFASFAFLCNGEEAPRLLSVTMNRVTVLHMLARILAGYPEDDDAHGSKPLAALWSMERRIDVDMSSVLTDLVKQGIALKPRASRHGVLPLPDERFAVFLAVARSQADLAKLQTTASQSYTKLSGRSDEAPRRMSRLRRGALSDSNELRVWALDGLAAVQVVGVLRPSSDALVLPPAALTPRDDEYIAWSASVLGIADHQLIRADLQADTTPLVDWISKHHQVAAATAEEPCNVLVIPTADTSSFQTWYHALEAAAIPNVVLSVLCERGSITRLERWRSVANQDTASAIEQRLQASDVPVCVGFNAGSVTDAVAAFDKLGVQHPLLVQDSASLELGTGQVVTRKTAKWLRGTAHRGAVVAVSDTAVSVASSDDGVPRSTCAILFGEEPDDMFLWDDVRLAPGDTIIGFRPTLDAARIRAVAKNVLEELKPAGPGMLRLVYRDDGKTIHLADTRFGSCTPVHVAALFTELYAHRSSAHYYKWTPPGWMDVWAFWQAVLDSDIALTPGTRDTGVFPLLFERGIACWLVLAGRDADEVQSLRSQVDEIMSHDAPDASAGSVPLSRFMDHKVRRLWVQSTRDNYRSPRQHYNIPNRALALLRPGLDLIILPGQYDAAHDMAKWAQLVLGISPDQVLFTQGKHTCMDYDIAEDADLRTQLKSIIQHSPEGPAGWAIVPYCASTKHFALWAPELIALGVSVVGDVTDWATKYGDKSILHRHIRDPSVPSVLESLGCGRIRVPLGYTCSTVEDLVRAYDILGCKDVIIKPTLGAAGEGIQFCSSVAFLKTYDFPYGDVLLEEKLNLDLADDGLVISPAVHYFEKAVFGDVCDQIMTTFSYVGWRRTTVTKSFVEQARRTVQTLLRRIRPNGPGGFDFLSVNGVPYLTDVNTGRFNGAHFPKVFQELYRPGSSWVCWKHSAAQGLTLAIWWRRCVKAHLAFLPGKTSEGVVPLLYNSELGSCQFLAMAASQETVDAIRASVSELLGTPPTEEELAVGPWNESDARGTVSVSRVVDAGLLDVLLLTNASAVYAPSRLPADITAVLCGGTKILALLTTSAAEDIRPLCRQVIDVDQGIITPGFVDIHVHVTGGGGEGGPTTRCPEIMISELVNGGCTSVVGVTGTDCVSRSLDALLTKCRALTEEGISAFMYNGSYEVPPATLTGSVKRDLMMIDQVVGVGEIAISDRRGTQPTVDEIARLASEAHVGGMLGGKGGILYCHIGAGPSRLQPLFDVIDRGIIPITSILPTHVGRTKALILEAEKWIRQGGFVDFSPAAGPRTIEGLQHLRRAGLISHVICSSDAGGSSPVFDAEGNVVSVASTPTTPLLRLLWTLRFVHEWPLEEILPMITSTPANLLKLPGKGSLNIGDDADVVVLSPTDLSLVTVVAKGAVMKRPGLVKRGAYEGQRYDRI